MSDHTTALVPIATALNASPELHDKNVQVDVGLLAEALVYYDQVLIDPGNAPQFGAFVRWFAQRDLLDDLVGLIRDGTIRIYDYSFLVNPMIDDGVFSLWNVTAPILEEPNSFARRLVDNGELIKEFPSHQKFDEFKRALDGRVIEVKAGGFGAAVENASVDFRTPERNALLTQVLLDELYSQKGLGKAPTVKVSVERVGRGRVNVKWNFDIERVARQIGFASVDRRVSAGDALVGLTLSTAAISNRLLLSAQQQWCDLYLPFPMSLAVGDKLLECTLGSDPQVTVLQSRISDLQHSVDFPDLRFLTNEGTATFRDAIHFRKKCVRFRQWLQQQSERDVETFYAYHEEAAKAQGWTRGARKLLTLFGMIGGPVIGSATAVATSSDPLTSTAASAAVGGGLAMLADAGKKMLEGWRPIGFGKWYSSRVADLCDAHEAKLKKLGPLGLGIEAQRAEEKRIRRRQRRLTQGRHT